MHKNATKCIVQNIVRHIRLHKGN